MIQSASWLTNPFQSYKPSRWPSLPLTTLLPQACLSWSCGCTLNSSSTFSSPFSQSHHVYMQHICHTLSQSSSHSYYLTRAWFSPFFSSILGDIQPLFQIASLGDIQSSGSLLGRLLPGPSTTCLIDCLRKRLMSVPVALLGAWHWAFPSAMPVVMNSSYWGAAHACFT
jgi:hypothetical protein